MIVEKKSPLWDIWIPEILGEYEGKWIGYDEGEIFAAGESLHQVYVESRERDLMAPIFAFVSFSIRA